MENKKQGFGFKGVGVLAALCQNGFMGIECNPKEFRLRDYFRYGCDRPMKELKSGKGKRKKH